ncbi:Uncharacterized protein LHYA1_G006168 [Lachnellula hyalina]|uniref:CID domain-containing protein n=1 Tax=Lachnellula hyalina TaxID=1316788 RepID=A0A8H8QW12_9HELO|nr:Uncharacterized protein LHYA1_G006168 [Lachnellula hyalina]TVY23867.1 Uncharacterized protein LHYA1_G006168 [Lachnellula hyalina]
MTTEFSDDVAEDYKRALEDLTMNSRYEISNLTVIARENTEHALAISEALKSHIKQTSPQKKLPAFYVLDSVIKNVGTPYTIFLSRGLYSTFMEAYALVDNSVRRKMDEMLKTWKEPVPGALDTRPVFPRDVTGPIENALIKARTSAIQAQQEHTRSQQQILGRGRPGPSPAPYRETPTPPNAYRQPPPVQQGYNSNYPQQQYPSAMNGQQYGQQPHVQQSYGLPPVSRPSSGKFDYTNQDQRPPTQNYIPHNASAGSWQQPPPQQGYSAHDNSIDELNSDIANLITVFKTDFALNPLDGNIQKRLKALLDLQSIMQSQRLPPQQISEIKTQVAKLSEASKATPKAPKSPTPAPVPAQLPQQNSLSSLLGPGGQGTLAALLAKQTPPIQTRSPQPALNQPFKPPPVSMAPTPVPDTGSLFEKLLAAGIISGKPAISTPTPNIPLPANISGYRPPFTPNPSRTPLGEIPNDVVLKTSSLKILYEKLGAPCTQCGRRFQSNEEGKKKKTAHMDWHFRVHQRMTEAEKRGQHRSWYVDELDWIKSREVEGDQNTSNGDKTNGSGVTSSSITSKPKLQYLPVPDDPALASSTCPICTEKFEMKWLDEAQEFVWMDAKKINQRIYHISCYEDVNKAGIKRDTPEPVLGKRKHEVTTPTGCRIGKSNKAQDDNIAVRSKIKTESY